MGGNATKQFGTSRIPNDTFRDIEAVFHSIDSVFVPKTFSKETHGDIDVIVGSADVAEQIKSQFGIEQTVVNGNVCSCVMPWNGELYQLDIISCPNPEFAVKWYSYGVMALLIGKVCPDVLKFTADGLVMREIDKIIETNFYAAIKLLGYDVNAFKSGFETEKEMLEWIANGKYFKPWRLARLKYAKHEQTREAALYLIDKNARGDFSSSLLGKFHPLVRQHRKEKKTLEYALRRARNLKRKYLLTTAELREIQKSIEENPKAWVKKDVPIELNYKRNIERQQNAINALLQEFGVKQPYYPTQEFLRCMVAELIHAGATPGYLMANDVAPALLKRAKVK